MQAAKQTQEHPPATGVIGEAKVAVAIDRGHPEIGRRITDTYRILVSGLFRH
jgi:hypothetical protein